MSVKLASLEVKANYSLSWHDLASRIITCERDFARSKREVNQRLSCQLGMKEQEIDAAKNEYPGVSYILWNNKSSVNMCQETALYAGITEDVSESYSHNTLQALISSLICTK